MVTSRNDLDTTDYGRSARPARSLADLSSEAFLLTFHIRSGQDPGHPDDVKKGITALIQQLEAKGGRHGHSEEDLKAVVYGLCELIDETILNSRGTFKDQWIDRPLQLQYFGELCIDISRSRRESRFSGRLLKTIPRANILADVAAVQPP